MKIIDFVLGDKNSIKFLENTFVLKDKKGMIRRD